jgi:hypothetical protein
MNFLSGRKKCVSVTKAIDIMMLLRELIALCFEIHTMRLNSLAIKQSFLILQ